MQTAEAAAFIETHHVFSALYKRMQRAKFGPRSHDTGTKLHRYQNITLRTCSHDYGFTLRFHFVPVSCERGLDQLLLHNFALCIR